MANTIFEKQGGTYTQVGDYMLPDLLPAEEEKEANIGVWAMRHKRYLKQNHKVFYYNLLTSGKLNSYLADIEQQAQDLFLRLVKQMAEMEGVTEQLKADNQMEWVGRMNNIRNRAMEMVNNDLIYTGDPAACISTSVETVDPPKVFWKYYDLYRRKRISLSEYAAATGLSAFSIRHFLKSVVEKSPKAIEKPKQI